MHAHPKSTPGRASGSISMPWGQPTDQRAVLLRLHASPAASQRRASAPLLTASERPAAGVPEGDEHMAQLLLQTAMDVGGMQRLTACKHSTCSTWYLRVRLQTLRLAALRATACHRSRAACALTRRRGRTWAAHCVQVRAVAACALPDTLLPTARCAKCVVTKCPAVHLLKRSKYVTRGM